MDGESVFQPTENKKSKSNDYDSISWKYLINSVSLLKNFTDNTPLS
ncbi:MAG: hypothetical protein ACE5SW_07085 [Nitrososphaeraceae archaeon]